MRILLAEDERSLSRAVKALLEKNNYSVDAVYDGLEALAYLESGNYDGVILDIMMPKLDGIAVLQRLRERGDPIPVLLLTAKSEVADKVLGLDTGANDYLTKPFATAELLARIRAMTRKQEGQAGSRLAFGNIVLDQATFELSSPAGSFRLANREYQMMELLLRNLGIRRVVLTGCMTDCCVINTAFDAANRDFRVVVPRDLTRGSEHLEEPALRMISLHLGLVVDSDALLDEWRSQK